MNTEVKDGIKYIVLNTPKTLNLKDELLRLSTESEYYSAIGKSTANFNKIVFLVHQINYWSKVDTTKKSYELNFKAHYEMLGVSGNLLRVMIDALIKLDIIKMLSSFNPEAKKSNRYVLVNPFNIKDENTVNKHFFNPKDPKCPKFIKKWVTDDYKVYQTYNSKYSETEKEAKAPKPKKLSEDERKELEFLRFENNRLNELIEMLETQCASLLTG